MQQAQVAVRHAEESALRINPDGTYTYIFVAQGSALNLAAPWKYFITKPESAGGTYTYVRNGDTIATLTLTERSSTIKYTLTYNDDVSGRVSVYPADSSTFYITDANDAERAPLSNVSLRGRVSSGHPLIGGIIVPGSHPRLFLVRVVGPSLAQFGVGDLWADPDFTVYKGTEVEPLYEVHYSDWSKSPYTFYSSPNPYDTAGGFTYLFKQMGLFELLADSKDAVALVWLTPGAHTVVCSAGAGDPGGEALIEVYSLP